MELRKGHRTVSHYHKLAISLPQDTHSFILTHSHKLAKSLPQHTKSFPQVNKLLPQDNNLFQQVSIVITTRC